MLKTIVGLGSKRVYARLKNLCISWVLFEWEYGMFEDEKLPTLGEKKKNKKTGIL